MSYQKIKWTIVPTALPTISKRCTKCGKVSHFINTEKFRINANKKTLDIWMIYHCQVCKTSYNLPLFERTNIKALGHGLYSRLQTNDLDLIWQYAFDEPLHKRHKVDLDKHLVPFLVDGTPVPQATKITLSVANPYQLPLKLDQVIQNKCPLSRGLIKKRLADRLVFEATPINVKKALTQTDLVIHITTHLLKKE